ncbi:hypothetical protein JTE90_012201 [Oedothorax gibbosus]|uniref:Protein FAM98A n=1 Tax=Oedothorax gibbosus TaxID=931172 RepID=A0AAV6VAC4_9ARAC|nr:hypothetical protein JTE90_012201 [Oedothorax gibbosus]
MDFDVLDSLEDLGSKDIEKVGDWKTTLELGPKSPAFTQLVESLTKELQTLGGMDSCVNAITDPEDSSSFLLEVSTFLKEMQCPYKGLLSGSISQRLPDVKSRINLLDYLCTQLQSARLLHLQEKNIPLGKTDKAIASEIKTMRSVLIPKSAVDENPTKMLTEIDEKVQEHLSSRPELIPSAAVTEDLTEENWKYLDSLHADFSEEYTVRRQMLLTRLDVTVQSFKWGENTKGKGEQIYTTYANRRNLLRKTPSVEVSDLIAARESILDIEKTSSAELVKNTKSAINRILIAAVPDRGGRPEEQRPAKEMPSWSKRQGGGGRGHHRGGGGGDRQKHFKGKKG